MWDWGGGNAGGAQHADALFARDLWGCALTADMDRVTSHLSGRYRIEGSSAAAVWQRCTSRTISSIAVT